MVSAQAMDALVIITYAEGSRGSWGAFSGCGSRGIGFAP